MGKSNSLGEYIANRRRELHLEQTDLVERLKARGVNRAVTTLSGWEQGRYQVPVEFLPAIADALEVSAVKIYEQAGILDNIRGHHILKLLDGLPDSEVAKVERMIAAYFQEAG